MVNAIEPAFLTGDVLIVLIQDITVLKNAFCLLRRKKMSEYTKFQLFPNYSTSVFITPKYWTTFLLNENKPTTRKLVWDGKRVVRDTVIQSAIQVRA